jgi:hypothetical protein
VGCPRPISPTASRPRIARLALLSARVLTCPEPEDGLAVCRCGFNDAPEARTRRRSGEICLFMSHFSRAYLVMRRKTANTLN